MALEVRGELLELDAVFFCILSGIGVNTFGSTRYNLVNSANFRDVLADFCIYEVFSFAGPGRLQ